MTNLSDNEYLYGCKSNTRLGQTKSKYGIIDTNYDGIDMPISVPETTPNLKATKGYMELIKRDIKTAQDMKTNQPFTYMAVYWTFTQDIHKTYIAKYNDLASAYEAYKTNVSKDLVNQTMKGIDSEMKRDLEELHKIWPNPNDK